MGRLKELAGRAGWSDLDKLVAALVSDPRWPEADTKGDVAKVLRALDVGAADALTWLDERPFATDLLADALGIDRAELDRVVAPRAAHPQLFLHELTDARPVDLLRDRLFPGIPEEVLDPKGRGLQWWFAMSGSGRSSVGRWLEARGAARYLRGRWEDVVGSITGDEPAFIELTSPEGVARYPDFADGTDITVAAPFFPVPLAELHELAAERRAWEATDEPDTEEPEADTGWSLVKTEEPGEWSGALLDWVADRTPTFPTDEAMAFFEKPFAKLWLKTPGDYLGMCGLLHRFGMPELLAMDGDQLVIEFLRARKERIDLPRTSLSADDLWTAYRGAMRGALKNAARADGYVRERDLVAWFPAEFPFTGADAVRELTRLHLLEPVGEGLLEMRPNWLTIFAGQAALNEMLDDPSLGLGDAFLHPKLAASAFDALVTYILPDDDDEEPDWDVAEWALDHLDATDGASVALLEAAFQAAGAVVLNQRHAAPADLLRRLWDAQMALAIPRFINAPPQPRILRLDADGRRLQGLWYIACFALSERLVAAGHLLPTSALAPWRSDTPPLFLAEALAGVVQTALPSKVGTEDSVGLLKFAADALVLGGRLIRRFGLVDPQNVQVRWLAAPFALLEQVRAGTPVTWHGRLAGDSDLNAVLALAEREHIPENVVLEALWRAGDRAGQPVMQAAVSRFSDPLAERAWRALPPDVLLALFSAALQTGEGIAWEWLSPAAWDGLVGWWLAHPHVPIHGLDDVPEEHARALIARRHGGFDRHATWRTFWDRLPDPCREAAYEELSSPPPEPLREGVAWATPEHAVEGLAVRLQARVSELRAQELVRLQVLRWAHIHTAARGVGWRAAFNLMTSLATG